MTRPAHEGPDRPTWRGAWQQDPDETAVIPVSSERWDQPTWQAPRQWPPIVPAPHTARPSRHRADDDLPGPSRRELARLVRQCRALLLAMAAGWLTYLGYLAWWYLAH